MSEDRKLRSIPFDDALSLVRVVDDDGEEMGDGVGAFFAANGLLHASESWTDDQWAEHDRKVAEGRARAAAEAEESRIRAKHGALEKAGFPLRALGAAGRADATRSAIVRLRDWDARERSIMVLSGPAGCGKTVAATWWAMQQRYAPAFVRASTFAASSRYDRETRGSWFDAWALVLDDLGTEYLDAKGSFLVDLDELLDVYYGSCKPLVITTNADVATFKTRYGNRIEDRIRECGIWFAMSDASMRKAPPKGAS